MLETLYTIFCVIISVLMMIAVFGAFISGVAEAMRGPDGGALFIFFMIALVLFLVLNYFGIHVGIGGGGRGAPDY